MEELLVPAKSEYSDDEAEPLFQRAIKIRRASLGDDHPNTKKIIANYEDFKANRDAE